MINRAILTFFLLGLFLSPDLASAGKPSSAPSSLLVKQRLAKDDAAKGSRVEEPDKMWPSNGTLTSVSAKEAASTEKLVVRGLPVPVKVEKEDERMKREVKDLDCDALDNKRIDLENEYKTLKVKANEDVFEVTRLHSTAVRIGKEKPAEPNNPEKLQAEKNAAALQPVATKDMNRYKEIEMELLFVIEQFSLKCGVKDKYCTWAGEAVNKLYGDLEKKKKDVSTNMMEAGWVKAESQAFMAPEEQVRKAKAKFEAAWTEAKMMFEDEQRLEYLVMLKAAACGLRPPLSPWSTPSTGCDLVPEDPEMKKLMKEDPREFMKRWKELIGRKAGIKPEYVRVDSECLGNIPDKKNTRANPHR